MKLRYIRLIAEDLNNDIDSKDFLPYFDFNCCFVSNYLSKAIRKLHIETEDSYKMILVDLSFKRSSCKVSRITNVLYIHLPVLREEMEHYKRMKNLEERYEFYLSLLERGYKFASTVKKIPMESLLMLHQQFRENCYKNEWLFKKKQVRDLGLYLFLKCYFTTFDFHLELEAYDLKQKELFCKGVILRTYPDEIGFRKIFEQIVIEDKQLIILDFLSHPSFKIDLIKIRNGEFNVNQIEWKIEHDDNYFKRFIW